MNQRHDEMVLVFEPQSGTTAIMDKPWHRKTDSRLRGPDVETAPPAADYGNAEVQFNLGLKFANGEGATPDYAQAAEWYGKAADQNHSLAQFNLGMMYARGQGVARDFIQSRIWFDRAAQQGDAGAQLSLLQPEKRQPHLSPPAGTIGAIRCIRAGTGSSTISLSVQVIPDGGQ